MSSLKRTGCFAGIAALLALVVGCASPGPPRPPSLHLPEVAPGVKAERRGDAVVVRFTTPVRSTDKEPLTAPVMAGLCRAVGDGPCRATVSFPGRVVVAGPVEWVDVLPAELAAGEPRRIAYRVETFSAAGRSAGPSEPVFAAAGAAPRVVEGFRAEGSHGGVVLRWTPEVSVTGEVLVEREALNAPVVAKAPKNPLAVPQTVGKRKKPGSTAVAAKKDDGAVWLHADANRGDRDGGGMVDASAVADTEYRYSAVRSRTVTVDGHKLEMRSEASAAVTFTLRDVYPPAVPRGLLAAGFPTDEGIAVDLVWQPNAESDLAGYNVYRQTLGSDAAAVKLTAAPVALPAFHDASAAKGVAYRYTVTAVDAKGNESAASVAAELAATP